jgi:hypothetical protein
MLKDPAPMTNLIFFFDKGHKSFRMYNKGFKMPHEIQVLEI